MTNLSRMGATAPSLALAWMAAAAGFAAEAGDFDGDGRITIADVVQMGEAVVASAPGSTDAFDSMPENAGAGGAWCGTGSVRR